MCFLCAVYHQRMGLLILFETSFWCVCVCVCDWAYISMLKLVPLIMCDKEIHVLGELGKGRGHQRTSVCSCRPYHQAVFHCKRFYSVW